MRFVVSVVSVLFMAMPKELCAQERLMDRADSDRHAYIDEQSRTILSLSPDTDDGLVLLTLLRPFQCPCVLQVTDMDGSSVYLEDVDLGQDETYPIELPLQGHRYILTLRSPSERATAIVMRQ